MFNTFVLDDPRAIYKGIGQRCATAETASRFYPSLCPSPKSDCSPALRFTPPPPYTTGVYDSLASMSRKLRFFSFEYTTQFTQKSYNLNSKSFIIDYSLFSRKKKKINKYAIFTHRFFFSNNCRNFSLF